MADPGDIERVMKTISPGTTEAPKKTFHGSCHCGFIKYTVALPESQLEIRTGRRCNCTVCLKQGMTSLGLPRSDFKLITPSLLAECKDYRINQENEIHKYFCGTCGVHVVGAGMFSVNGGEPREFFQINLVTLDQPQEGLDLSQWKIVYVDGRRDGFLKGSDHPHPGGIL